MAQYSLSRGNKLKPQKNDDIHEVVMITTKDGFIVDSDNPLPVSIGGESVTITGDVNIPGNIEISNDVGNPIPVIGTTVNPWGNQVVTVDDDTVQHTSKNRRKVSTSEIIDYASFTEGTQTDVWDEVTNGTGSITHDPYLGMVELEVGATAGDEVIRQTHRVVKYIPGRQNEVSMALIFGTPTAGIRRRFGLFDDNNGIFFEDVGTTYNVVVRRNTSGGVVENRVSRDNWNVDKLDGTGPSGITADPEAIQFMVIEYEWSGHGQVEFKFVIDNNAYAVHRFNHGNEVSYTWATTPLLPVRIELTNVDGVAGTHTFLQGVHTVSSEGKVNSLGRVSSVSNAITGRNNTSSGTFYPNISIRLKSGNLNSVVMPQSFTAATLDNTGMFIRVIEDATVSGGTWVSYDANSPVEYNITPTSFTGGETLMEVYVSPGNNGNAYEFLENVITQLYRTTTTTIGDTSSTFTIATATVGSNKDTWASLRWVTVR